MKTKNYLSVACALEELSSRAMAMRLPKETPYGSVEDHQISGIRILYLAKESYQQSIVCGLQYSQKHLVDSPQLLMSLFYKHQFSRKGKMQMKLMRRDFAFSGATLLTPEGILLSGWGILAEQIDALFSDFYSSDVKENVFFQEANSEPIRLSDEEFELPVLESIPQSFSEFAAELSSEVYSLSPTISTNTNISNSRDLWIVVDHEGRRTIDYRDSTVMSLNLCLISRTKRTLTQTFPLKRHSFDAIVQDKDLLYRDIQSFLDSRERKQLESGIYPFLFTPAAVGTLFHEALAGHMLSGNYIAHEESTIFKGKLNKQIANDQFMVALTGLTIWDCPCDENMMASYHYDMEGEKARDVCLMRNGVLENYLLDRNSSSLLKLKNNGHCLGGNLIETLLIGSSVELSPVYPEPRVSNLKILSTSSTTLEELKQDLFCLFGYCFWVDSHAGAVNVETGVFELKVDYLVKEYIDGQKEYYHGGVLAAHLTDFLSAICVASNHYAYTQGCCGAESGWIPTEEYAPAMSVYGVNWIPDSLPEKNTLYDSKRDKYLMKPVKTKKFKI